MDKMTCKDCDFCNYKPGDKEAHVVNSCGFHCAAVPVEAWDHPACRHFSRTWQKEPREGRLCAGMTPEERKAVIRCEHDFQLLCTRCGCPGVEDRQEVSPLAAVQCVLQFLIDSGIEAAAVHEVLSRLPPGSFAAYEALERALGVLTLAAKIGKEGDDPWTSDGYDASKEPPIVLAPGAEVEIGEEK